MLEYVKNALDESHKALSSLRKDDKTLRIVEDAARKIAVCLENDGRVFSCGNGGSMCDSMHFAEEMSGRFRKNRKGLAAIAISDPGHMSCVANDFGYDYVFSRYIESHGKEGDVLLMASNTWKIRTTSW